MAITPEAPGQISPPNTLTGEAVGVVAVPNTLTGEAVGVVAAPNTLTGEAVGTVSAPNTLTGEAVGSVSAPNTLTANAAGSVSAPNTLTGEAVGSVSAPNTLVGVTPAAFPRTLTPLVDMNFATKSYAQSGTPVAFDDLFTYSRASSATFTNRRAKATGGYEYFLDTDYVGDVENLLTYSEQFDNAAWVTGDATVSPVLSESPFGEKTANKIIPSINNQAHQVSRSSFALSSGVKSTFTIYAKSAGYNWLLIVPTTKDAVTTKTYISLIDGSPGAIGGGHTVSTESVGGGWFKCSISFDAGTGATTAQIRIRVANANGGEVYPGDGTSGIYIWGAQLTESAKPLPYVKTLDAPVTQTFSETLRTEYDAATGENLGALIEGGSTNLALRSEEFDNAAWVNTSSTITSNATTAPDGTLSADKFTDSVDVSEHFMEQSNINQNNNTFTASLYIKRSNTDDFYFGIVHVGQSPTTSFADYNFVSDTFTGLNGLITSGTSKKLDNGWVRISITYTLDALVTSHRIRLKTIPGVVAGTGTSCYIWGAQVEALPFASSYIRTEGAAVSRSADNLSLPNSGNLPLSGNNQTIDMSFKLYQPASGTALDRYLWLGEAAAGGANPFFYVESNDGSLNQRVGTTVNVVVPANSGFAAQNVNFTSVLNISDNTIKGYIDNIFVSTSDAGGGSSIDGSGDMGIMNSTATTRPAWGHISKFATYDKALTAQEITLL